MTIEKKPQEIDLGLTVGLCTLLIGAAYYCGNALKEISGNDEGLTIEGLPWVIATGFFAALSLTSFLALVGKAVTTISQQPSDSWVVFTSTMLKFSLYVLIRWFALWGIPFFIAMSVFLLLKPISGTAWAIVLTIITIPLAFIVTFKILPSPAIPQDSRIKLSTTLGKFRTVVIIVGCFLIAQLFVSRCYTFNVEGFDSLYEKPATLEMKVSLSGVINNKDKLTAEMYRIDAEQVFVGNLDLVKYDNGKYMAWRTLDDLEDGVYRVDIFFRNYTESSNLKKYELMIGNNHRRQRFAFKLIKK